MSKNCAKCDEEKSLKEFHRQGDRGRHSWCRECYNTWNRARRKKRPRRYWRERNFVQRYGITDEEAERMLREQGGCALCGKNPDRPCVDHCHDTGKVRGVLCHRCNILLAGVENGDFLSRALDYLGES